MAGCMISRGAATVLMPTASAGVRVGLLVQVSPTKAISNPEKATPTT